MINVTTEHNDITVNPLDDTLGIEYGSDTLTVTIDYPNDQPTPDWLFTDTFTGSDGTTLNGSAADLAPNQTYARYSQYGNSQINGNRAYVCPAGPGLVFAYLGVSATRIKWDYFNTGNYTDLYFYQSYNYTDNFGYFIRINAGIPLIYKRYPSLEQMSFASGDIGSGLTSGTATLDLYANGFTLTLADNSSPRVLTYTETPMINTDQLWFGYASNGGYFDNIYAR